MLDALRRGTGSWAVKILLGLLIVSFAAWGIGDIFRGGSDPVIAQIGDAKISTSDFHRSFQRRLRRFQESGSPITSAEARTFGLDLQVLDNMASRLLFNQHINELGVGVSDRRIAKEIQGNPAFRNTFGDYDKFRLRQILQANGMSEEEYVDMVRADIRLDQLLNLVELVDRVPDALVERLYRHNYERRIAQLVIIPNDRGSIGSPTEDDLTTLHEENAAEFTSPEYRTVSYLALAPQDLTGEIQIAEDEMRTEYEQRIAEFTVIGRRTVDQIVLEDEDAATAAYGRLVGGAKFAAVAREVADLSPEDMDLGALARDEFLSPELAEVAFSAPEGGITPPTSSELGWHLFRVRKIELGSVKPFEQARERIERDMRLGRATDALYDFANRVDDELGGGASLEETAGNLSVRFATLGPIDRQGKNEAGKKDALLPESPIFLEQAFAAQEGLDTGLVETPEGDYYVLRVDHIRPSVLRSLDFVRREVLEKWEQKERARASQAIGEELMEAAKGADMLARLAKGKGYRVRTTEPLLRDGSIPEAALARSQLSTLFTLRPGDATSAPTPSGNSHVIATLVTINSPDPASDFEGVSKLRIAIADEMPTDISTQYRDALEAEAGGTLIYQRSLDNYFGDGA